MGNELKVGDVVKLKSNGPKMTIDSVADTEHVVCVWFEGSQHRSALFVGATLMHVEAASANPHER